MADAMLSTRGKGSKQGSSSEGKGKSLKKNVCKDDRKVPSEEGPIERVIKDVEKSSARLVLRSSWCPSRDQRLAQQALVEKKTFFVRCHLLITGYSGRTDIPEKRHEYDAKYGK